MNLNNNSWHNVETISGTVEGRKKGKAVYHDLFELIKLQS